MSSDQAPWSGRRVAIVHDWFQGFHGSERVVRSLADDVFPEAATVDIHTFHAEPDLLPESLSERIVSESRLAGLPGLRQVGHDPGRWRYLLPYMPFYFRSLDLAGYDLVIASSHAVAHHVRPPAGVPFACYCHSPMRYAWVRRIESERGGGVRGLALGAAAPGLRRLDRKAAQRPDRYYANSEAVRERIASFYGREAEVVHPPVDLEGLEPGEIAGGTFLWVNRLVPYKRPDLVVEAFRRLPHLQLTMVGVGPMAEALRAELPANVRLEGWLPRDELAALYGTANGLVHVGEEDFGMSMVEALASGTPVIALRRGGAVDIVRDGVDGVLLDDADPASIAEAAERMLEADWDRETLRTRAQAFSREAFAESMRGRLAGLMDAPWEVSLSSELPAQVAVGAGTRLFVSGRLAEGEERPGLSVRVGAGPAVPVLSVSRSAEAAGLDFHAIAPVPVDGQAEVADVTLLRGARESLLGRVELLPELAAPSFECPPAHPGTVAICMATHDPDPELLERQLDSISRQTHDDWILLISDDCSSPETAERLRALADSDPRIALSASSKRLGFYLNFERALSMVPADAEWVALSDQDDRWYPEKLDALLGAIGEAQLAYSDMKIVDPQGGVIAPSFWMSRRNNYSDLGSLLLANTVTGAASLFRRSLLERALPFPLAPGGPFHDHWIASVALATGSIRFVDRPLQDYVQHGSAALGHSKAMRGYRPGRVVRLSEPRKSADRVAEHGRRTYVTNSIRLALQAQVLEVRAADLSTPDKLRTIRRVGRLAGPREPLGWVAARAARPALGRNETAGIELSLIAAAGWRRATGRGRSGD